MRQLKGTTVRIIISQPNVLSCRNLFGTIAFARGKQSIVVKLTNEIQGKKLTSDLLELIPINEKETFTPLTQYYSVMINGALVKEDSEESEHILTGSVTWD